MENTAVSLKKTDTGLRDQLVTDHMHLVHAIAGNVRRSISVHIEMDDLVHAGMAGLFDAATRYRDDKEVSFATYAKHRIRGAILDSLRQVDWATRETRRMYKRVQTVANELSMRLNRVPTQEEIAEAMGLDQLRWQALMSEVGQCGIGAGCRNEREDEPTKEVAAPRKHSPEFAFTRTEIRAKLSAAMRNLPMRHRQVVQLYYERDLTMKEIGAVMGVNESRVSQIHKSALMKMQCSLGSEGICSPAALC